MDEDSQQKYLTDQGIKLSNPNTDIKTYWAILKSFLNKVKIPCIPPILYNNIFITDFQEKARLFNDFFAKQCTILDTGSVLPPFVLLTDKLLSDVVFNEQDILDIIRSLDQNKAHGWDDISVRMIKMCGDGLVEPLTIIFNNCILLGVFPDMWKKANVVPVFKKRQKSCDKKLSANFSYPHIW